MITIEICAVKEVVKQRKVVMVKFQKIETVFNRATDGSKKLVEGSYQSEIVKYLAGNAWVCTEKIDGTNVGIVWDGYAVHFQGRSETSSLPSKLVEYLMNTFLSDEVQELFEQKFGEMKVVLFGEGYGAGIQKGKAYRNDLAFILFDVYLPEKDLWLKRDAIEDIAQCFNIEAVPVIMTGTLSEAVEFVKARPNSTIGNAKMEGLVCKPLEEVRDRMGNRVVVKVKCKDFPNT